jgi:hypothetical protein
MVKMHGMQVPNKSVWYNIKQAEMKERRIQEEERKEGISEYKLVDQPR